MNLFLVCFIAGAGFLLGFLLFFHPLHQNIIANRWLSLFVIIIGCAFTSTYMIKTGTAGSNIFLFKCFNSLQFLLAPSLYISIRYFVNPGKVFKRLDWLHFIPFVVYAVAENIFHYGEESISTYPLFPVNKNVVFLVRDLLPFLTLFYLVRSYIVLHKHQANLKLVSSSISQVNLNWLIQFLVILSVTVITWINDALLELPFLTEATPFIYTVSIFFLAYFSIRQKAIFAFKEKDMQEISDLLDYEIHTPALTVNNNEATVNSTSATDTEVPEPGKGRTRMKRLSAEQVEKLSARLTSLMEDDKLYLDNELTLPMVAEKLGISIHEASFLVNETAKENFYTYINKYRVEEAKKLLASAKMEELNILGIAFASGFNSKTTFNTTFKKIVGISPSQYSKQQKNAGK